MIITKKTIFYFSGTGNSLQVAKDIAAQLGDVQLLSIPKIINNDKIEVQAECIGIVFPVYMWGLPLIVDDFIKKISINKLTYIFAVANCGGSPGNALKQVDNLIKKKDSRLNAGFSLKMPDNYIVMYGARSVESQNKLFEKEKVKVQKIVKTIESRKDYGCEKSKVPIHRIFAPILYKQIYKLHIKDKNFLAKNNCTGCGVCEKICGVNNIEIKNGKPSWKNNCQQCMACIQYCPEEAIEYGRKTIGRKRYTNPNISLKEMLGEEKDK